MKSNYLNQLNIREKEFPLWKVVFFYSWKKILFYYLFNVIETLSIVISPFILNLLIELVSEKDSNIFYGVSISIIFFLIKVIL
jgi:hypothetical protein